MTFVPLAVAAVTAVTVTAAANAPERPASTAARSVVVVVAEPEAAAQACVAALESHLMEPSFEIVVAAPVGSLDSVEELTTVGLDWARRHAVAGTIIVDLRQPAHVSLHLVRERQRDVYSRQLPRVPEGDAMTYAEVAVVVSSLGQTLESTRAPTSTSAPDPAGPDPAGPGLLGADREPSPRPWLELLASYTGHSLTRGLRWQHGVGAALEMAPRPRVLVGASYRFVVPQSIERDGLTVQLLQHGASIYVGFAQPLHPAFTLDLLAGPRLDVVQRRARSTDDALRANADSRRVVAGATALVRGRIRVSRRVRLYAGAGLETAFNASPLVIATEEGSREFLRPPPVRARVVAGIAFDMLYR